MFAATAADFGAGDEHMAGEDVDGLRVGACPDVADQALHALGVLLQRLLDTARQRLEVEGEALRHPGQGDDAGVLALVVARVE